MNFHSTMGDVKVFYLDAKTSPPEGGHLEDIFLERICSVVGFHSSLSFLDLNESSKVLIVDPVAAKTKKFLSNVASAKNGECPNKTGI